MSTSSSFDVYRPSEEHDAVREAVRVFAEDKIAPFRGGGRRAVSLSAGGP